MISVVIPTYKREEPLIDTITQLLAQGQRGLEILVVDQTPWHSENVQRQLSGWHASGTIVWLQQQEPSIPAAMNRGLQKASNSIVLFVDDDIHLEDGFVQAHLDAHTSYPESFIAGQVIQPWQKGDDHQARDNTDVCPDEFDFSSNVATPVDRVMAGNLSVVRDIALALGGFDENFIGAAYRFEAEFSDRARHAGIDIRFEPAASIDHLHADSGGTRAHGHFLTTSSHAHTSGKYYYLLIANKVTSRWMALATMPFRSVMTRHHLRRPWWIPVSLLAEGRGLIDAIQKCRKGRKLLQFTADADRETATGKLANAGVESADRQTQAGAH